MLNRAVVGFGVFSLVWLSHRIDKNRLMFHLRSMGKLFLPFLFARVLSLINGKAIFCVLSFTSNSNEREEKWLMALKHPAPLLCIRLKTHSWPVHLLHCHYYRALLYSYCFITATTTTTKPRLYPFISLSHTCTLILGKRTALIQYLL